MNILPRWFWRAALIGLVLVALAGGSVWAALYVVPAPYQPEDTPQGVAYNYQLAIIRQDYPRAYACLSPTLAHFPASADEFKAGLQRSEGGSQIRRCVYIETVKSNGDQATVTLFEQWYAISCARTQPSSPENLSYNFLEVDLQREDQGWKIIDSSGHFARCWTAGTEECR